MPVSEADLLVSGERQDDKAVFRIGYLINQYPKPSHTFIRTEMQELERRGHDVARLAIRGWEDVAASPLDAEEQSRTEYLLKAGIGGLLISVLLQFGSAPLRTLQALVGALRLGRGSQVGLVKHVIYFIEACWLARWTRRQGVQHLHAHFGTNTAAVATILHNLNGLPFSFTVHGPDEFDAPRELKLREKAAAAAFVVAITSYCRSQLFRWVDPQHWQKVRIIRCTPDRTFLDAAPVDPSNQARLVCVGRLCEQKGQLTLIESVRDVVGDGIDVRLVLAGDGPMRPEIEDAIRVAGLEDRVTITGWIDSGQVKQQLLAADALVLPSYAEGLPIVVMEAMALGRPVLSTMIAGIPELVRNGVDGFLVPAGDSSQFADAIRRFLALSSDELQMMASNCRQRVRERHDPDREVGALANLIGASVESHCASALRSAS